MTTQNLGMSKRSLLLLGGLTAAVTNPTARQKLLSALNSAADSAQAAYQDTVRPLAQQAQAQLQAGVQEVGARTQELAQVAAERGAEFAHVAAERGADLAQVAAKRGTELAQVVTERGGELAHVAAKRGSELASQGTEVAAGVAAGVASLAAERGGKVAAIVREGVSELQGTGGRQVQGLFGSAQDTLKDAQHTLGDVRKDGGKAVAKKVRQGRRQAMKLQQELGREVSVRGRELEKLSGKKLRQAEKELAELRKRSARAQKAVRKTAGQTLRRVKGEPEPSGSALSAVLVTTGLVIAGGVLLARVPAVRHSILKAVGSVSPEAEGALHRAGTSVRDLVGSVWLERIEPETATPAPAPKDSQAIGSAAGASVEPGAPAQATPPAPEGKAAEESIKN